MSTDRNSDGTSIESIRETTCENGNAMAPKEHPGSEPLLHAKGITKAFTAGPSPAQVLGGVSLSIRRGEFVTVMGPSGSGKSTLLYCLSGLDRPSSGSVAFEGRQLTELNDAKTAHVRLTQMGFVFQQAYFLDNLNIRDNILLPALKAAPGDRRGTIARVDALMERFGIAPVALHGVTEVSGGQLQRAALCRGLATRPTILFADEPTGALNSSMSAEVMDALTETHRTGATVAMVTHSPTLAARADRVVYLRDGLVADTLALGSWSEDRAARREDELQDWLREKGY